MILHINAVPRDFPDGLTIAALVEQLGMKPDRVAVELNLEIVPRANWQATLLNDGDKLEIVHFVGGGADAEEVVDTEPSVPLEPPAGAGWLCPSCSALATASFCGSCGEKKPSPHDLSIGHLIAHAGEALFHWDSKIFRTLRVLLTRPGLLSDEYVKGRRKPYVHPFQVFFIANLCYFLLYPILDWSGLKASLFSYEHWMWYSGWATRMATHRAAVRGLSMAELGRRFEHVIDIQSRSLVLLMVPLFALALLVVESSPKRYLGEHLVFSLHYFAAFLLVIMIALSGAFAVVRHTLLIWAINPRMLQQDYLLSSLAAIIMGRYLFAGLRRFYLDSRLAAIAKAAALVGATYLMLQTYQIVLFLTALYSA